MWNARASSSPSRRTTSQLFSTDAARGERLLDHGARVYFDYSKHRVTDETIALLLKLGLVVNELVTNAFQHGASPIVVHLKCGSQTRLRVDDDGRGVDGVAGFGLDLVRRMVEQGLDGRFELSARPGGGTRAEAVFPMVSR